MLNSRKTGFDSFFCVPGKDGAHEKGGVEGEIGRFRRRHLVPVPAVASLAALNQLIAAADMVDDGRVITGRPVTIAAAFAEEQPAMLPLPAEPFDPARLLAARVDARARVCVRQNYYSVPAGYAGRRLPVRLSATAVEVLDGSRVVARHERVAGKYAEILVLDHYLEVLARKPGALPGATALARARYATTAALVNELVEAADQRALSRVVGRYGRLDLLRLDELGYIQIDPQGAELLSRSSPSGTNEPPSRSGQTSRSAHGAPSSLTPAWSPPSSTGSPSTPISSRPAPSPTGSAPAKPRPAAQSPANAVTGVGVV